MPRTTPRKIAARMLQATDMDAPVEPRDIVESLDPATLGDMAILAAGCIAPAGRPATVRDLRQFLFAYPGGEQDEPVDVAALLAFLRMPADLRPHARHHAAGRS